MRKVDKRELRLVKQIVLAAFVDNPHEVVFDCARVRENSIDFAQNQRGFVARILEAERKSSCQRFMPYPGSS